MKPGVCFADPAGSWPIRRRLSGSDAPTGLHRFWRGFPGFRLPAADSILGYSRALPPGAFWFIAQKERTQEEFSVLGRSLRELSVSSRRRSVRRKSSLFSRAPSGSFLFHRAE